MTNFIGYVIRKVGKKYRVYYTSPRVLELRFVGTQEECHNYIEEHTR